MDFQGEELEGPAAGGTAIISTDASGKILGYGKNRNLCGYGAAASYTFLIGYNLQQPTFLYYDGHPEYDYPFAFGTSLFPSITFYVTYPPAAPSPPPNTYHVLTI